MLLDTYLRLAHLASTMDMNDFNHVSCAYLPRASGSGNQFALLCGVVPVPLIAGQVCRCRPIALMPLPAPPSEENPSQTLSSLPPSTRADFDVSEYLIDKSPIIDSKIEKPLDEYGSLLNHEVAHIRGASI